MPISTANKEEIYFKGRCDSYPFGSDGTQLVNYTYLLYWNT